MDDREAVMGVAGRLTPDVKQPRAAATVEAVIDATIALLDERDGSGIPISDISERSGVSIGSIYHHFGDRDGILSAAHASRFDASEQAQLARTRSMFTEGPSVTAVLEAADALVAGLLRGEHDVDRRARIQAFCAGRHRPELLANLSASFRGLVDAIAVDIAVLCDAGVLAPGVDPRAYAVFSQVYGAGRIADRLHPKPLPVAEWWGLHRRMVHGFVSHDCAGDCPPLDDGAPTDPSGRPDTAVPARTVALPRPESQRAPAAWRALLRVRRGPDPKESAVLSAVAALLREVPAESIVLSDLRSQLGVSPSWVQRTFGDRDGLVEAARVQLLLEQSEKEAVLLEGVVDGATSPDALLEGLVGLVEVAADPARESYHWNRMELMAAALGEGPIHGSALGEGVAASLSRTTAAFERAAERGVLARQVTPRALARFLWGYPYAFVLTRAAGVPPQDWGDVSRVALRSIVLAEA